MNSKKEKAVIHTTPEGTLVFVHLIKPDTQFNRDFLRKVGSVHFHRMQQKTFMMT